MRLRILAVVPATLLLFMSFEELPAQAQPCWVQWESLGGPYNDVQRSRDLSAPATNGHAPAVRRAGQTLLRTCGGSPADGAIAVLPATAIMEYNSAYARPGLDGLRWAGRGVSAAVTAGAGGRWKWFSAVLAPVASYQQNTAFRIEPVVSAELSPFGSYYHSGLIDMPQRFGDQPFWWYSLGQSFVRADAFGAAIGFSTENLRWGPAQRNPLLMGAGAPGFPHVFLGTSEPVDVRIGRLEIEAIWGRVSESEYFDFAPDNDRPFFGGLVVAFSPAGSGLTLGVARSYMQHVSDDFSILDQFVAPYRRISKNEADNELLSAFMHWVLPTAGFEVYGEYARDDAWENVRDLTLEPDHSRAITGGLHKVFERANGDRLRVMAEASTLGSSSTFLSGRGKVHFYTHAEIRQGYTNRGRLLGAPIGVGSDAQYLGVDYLGRNFLAGISMERVRYDNDSFYDEYAERFTYGGHDTEITLGLRGGANIRDIQLIGELARSSRRNRQFLGLRDGTGYSLESNIGVSLGASWTPRTGRIAP